MGSGDDVFGLIFHLYIAISSQHVTTLTISTARNPQATKTESTNILSRPVPSNPLSRSLTQAIYPVLQPIASLTPTPRR
jgi:hypothetical protein